MKERLFDVAPQLYILASIHVIHSQETEIYGLHMRTNHFHSVHVFFNGCDGDGMMTQTIFPSTPILMEIGKTKINSHFLSSALSSSYKYLSEANEMSHVTVQQWHGLGAFVFSCHKKYIQSSGMSECARSSFLFMRHWRVRSRSAQISNVRRNDCVIYIFRAQYDEWKNLCAAHHTVEVSVSDEYTSLPYICICGSDPAYAIANYDLVLLL